MVELLLGGEGGAVGFWGEAEVLFDEFAEEGEGGEAHGGGDFFDGFVGVAELSLDGADGVLVDVVDGWVAANFADDVGEVFGGDVHQVGDLGDATDGAFTAGEDFKELARHDEALGRGGVGRGVDGSGIAGVGDVDEFKDERLTQQVEHVFAEL